MSKNRVSGTPTPRTVAEAYKPDTAIRAVSTIAAFPIGDARITRVPPGPYRGLYSYRCNGCGAEWSAPPGRRTGDPPWWVCPAKGPPCNDDVWSEYKIWNAAESQRERDEHARRVEAVREQVEHDVDELLAEPDAERFASRMTDERPRTAEENLALVRGTDPRPTVTERAEKRTEDVEAGKWKGKQRRGECRFCRQGFWFYPSRQRGHFCSEPCRTRFWNLKRSRA